MSTFDERGSALTYDLEGDGPPLLLIADPGEGWTWYRQRPELSRSLRVITLDPAPGPGGVPDGAVDSGDDGSGPDAAARVADAIAALLEHLRIDRACVLGASRGGFVAIELALRHPARVRGLLLCATHFGGKDAAPAPARVRRRLEKLAGGEETAPAVRRLLPLLFTGDGLEQSTLSGSYLAHRLAAPPSPAARSLSRALDRFDAGARVSSIRCPTLVMTGDDDPIVRPLNARLLVERIRGARLCLFPHLRHRFFIEAADAFNERVLRFVETLR
jgi:pimeloyl-ACP methyl ester carboxylesterase